MIRTVGIVSLSSGILGEPFVQHEVRLGLARLQDYGLQVRFLPHARAGLEALRAHPEWRAEDLLQAFRDPEIDLILCAIGGDDTYRLAPYLFEIGELQRAVTQKPFLGFFRHHDRPFHAPQGRAADVLRPGVPPGRLRAEPDDAALHPAVF